MRFHGKGGLMCRAVVAFAVVAVLANAAFAQWFTQTGTGTTTVRLLTSNDNVGIGTTNILIPAQTKLQVGGAVGVGFATTSATTYFPQLGLGTSGGVAIGLGLGSTAQMPVSGNTKLLVNGGAAIGYGTTQNVPGVGLAVSGPTSIGLATATTNLGNVKLLVNGGAAIGYGTSQNAPTGGLAVSGAASIGLGTATTNLPTGGLLVNGVVGIGTTNPSDKLTVLGGSVVVRTTDNMNKAVELQAGPATGSLLCYGPSNDIAAVKITSAMNGPSWITSGNVGIGTTSPGAKLEVGGQVKITGGSPGLNKILTSDANGLATWQAAPTFTDLWGTNGTDVYRSSGNVGIGTTSPNFMLTVNGGVSCQGLLVQGYEGSATFEGANGNHIIRIQPGVYPEDPSGISANSNFHLYAEHNMQISAGDTVQLLSYGAAIINSPKVGIGKTPTNEVLEVNGNTQCDTVKCAAVKINNWSIEAPPDYVFEKSYKLPSLKDVERHITVNKHLPGVPSAAQMKKQGLDLARMNMALLKKVEELTLYAIQQQKEIDQLKAVHK